MEHEHLLYYLISGVKEWERDFHVIPKKVQKGQQLLAFACALNDKEPPTDLSILVRMLMQPIEKWEIVGLTAYFPSNASIINRQYEISDEAEDFLSYYQHPEEKESSIVENILNICREQQLDEDYVKIRTFLSNPNHAVMDAKKLQRFKRRIPNDELANLFIACYEEVAYISNYKKCPNCGWTLKQREGAWHCNKDQTCRQLANFTNLKRFEENEGKMYRMKPGVQKYTLLPGMAEEEIAKRLREKGYTISIYPNIDEEDIAIVFDDYSVYIDVKDYRNPYTLAQYLIQKKPSKNSWYVIPSYHEEIFPAYKQIVQQCLKEANLPYRIVMEQSLIEELEVLQHDENI